MLALYQNVATSDEILSAKIKTAPSQRPPQETYDMIVIHGCSSTGLMIACGLGEKRGRDVSLRGKTIAQLQRYVPPVIWEGERWLAWLGPAFLLRISHPLSALKLLKDSIGNDGKRVNPVRSPSRSKRDGRCLWHLTSNGVNPRHAACATR